MSNGEDGGDVADAEVAEPQPLEIPIPGPTTDQNLGDWKLIAHNRKVLDGWRLLCRQLPENAVRCHRWLREHPTTPIQRRCYALKHKHYAGVWCYEIGSAERIYYKLRHDVREVLIYYAGAQHPKKVPYPPADD
jgi:hypothetical protein